MAKKRIGVLTSGGDCAGLNAVIRAVTRHASEGYGWEVVGILDGTRGVMERPMRTISLEHAVFSGTLLRQGGTILGTVNKGDPFAFPMPDGSLKDRSGDILDGIQELGLSGVIGIGGDGSMKLLNRLAKQGGFQFIGVPKTIDNDVPSTDDAVGFSTAVDTAVDALDRLQPTAASHQRVLILEVMGRDAGHIALSAGIAGGADVILIPEIPYNMEVIAKRIRAIYDSGRHHSLMVVAEAVNPVDGDKTMHTYVDGESRYGGVAHMIGHAVQDLTGAETRVTVLGYVQRGGTPTPRDRVIASAFGVAAVDLIAEGKTEQVVTWRENRVIPVPLQEIAEGPALVDLDGTLVRTARGLHICLGD
ncbi:MAG: ATP-dependent 6-phosphofructokinase [Magnetospiraceae bacterium]